MSAEDYRQVEEQGVQQDQFCAECRKGDHEACIRRIDRREPCCCGGQPNKQRELISTAGKASSKHPNSLRATVPEGIVAFLGLEKSDSLLWKMDYDPKLKERFLTVTRKPKPHGERQAADGGR